ncbi:zinc ABC transporter solute-binding protein [Halomonas sp. ZH2S]|uniref:Zinc ABC transporter solute-binding protein n=1 Tax=Vreelandella zhuhanensis TaxID=2684210 RepID=A0A7X3GZR9_9GAMM|nr:zinc ABC transporter solute-binding protein [Halomonas zhuhanensis]
MHKVRSYAKGLIFSSFFALNIGLITSVSTAWADNHTPLEIVATFSVPADLVERVAGEHGNVTSLTPRGAEAHDWELTPSNFMALEDADIVFYNGFNLEQWMSQVRATLSEDVPLVELAAQADYPTLPIITGDYEGETDPHMWMDPRAAAAYVNVIAESLAEKQPAHADAFHQRAEDTVNALYALHQELTELLGTISDNQRLLITSEAAFSYFADAYGFTHNGIWGTNSETEGTPSQVMRVIDLVNTRQPKALFWESTISDRHVTAIARDTQVEIAGPLYVDSLSSDEGPAADYFALMRHNAKLLRDTLGGIQE